MLHSRSTQLLIGRRLVRFRMLVVVASVLLLGWAAEGAVAASSLPFADINTMFLFGDSYTLNGFDPKNGYNLSNQTSITSSGGPAWPDYLVNNTAASPTLRNAYFDFARGGATASAKIQLSGYPNISLSNQTDDFERYFVNTTTAEALPGRPEWATDTTLFSIWIGLNDIEITWRRGEAFPPLIDSVFAEYTQGVDRLYKLGARHFLISLLPPYHRAPVFTTRYPNASETIQQDLVLWNNRLKQFTTDLTTVRPDASVTVWDAWSDFSQILDRPSEFAFLNTDSFCEAYAKYAGVPNPPSRITNIANCTVPLSQYVWINQSHPSTSVHRYLAYAIAQVLMKNASTPSTGLYRRNLRVHTHHHLPSLSARSLHERFLRVVRRSGVAQPDPQGGFWGKLRDTAVGSVVAGTKVGQ